MELGPEKLSVREQEILRLAADGMTDKEIAGAVGVQMSTVRTYWDRIKIKLQASNRTEAVARSLKPPPHEAGVSPELESVAAMIPHLLAVLDSDGNVEFANSRWQEYFGLPVANHEDWLKSVHPEDLPKASRIWKEAAARRRELRFQLRYRREDGVFRWHLTTMSPFHARQGSLFRWVWSAVDIHELGVPDQPPTQVK